MSNIMFKGTAVLILSNPPCKRGMSDSQQYTLNLYTINYVEEIFVVLARKFPILFL